MNKDFDSWNIMKKQIHGREFVGYVQIREIWWCSLGYNVGDEEDGKNENFERPVLVLKKFNKRIVLVVPLSTKIKDNIYYYLFTRSNTRFAVILSQLRLISTNRLIRKIHKMDLETFRDIKKHIINIIT